MQNKIHQAEKLTENNTALTLNIAANYGGCWDIVQATKSLAQQVKEGKLAVDEINAQVLQQALVTKEQPQVDLLIRTSGEQRISNFYYGKSRMLSCIFLMYFGQILMKRNLTKQLLLINNATDALVVQKNNKED